MSLRKKYSTTVLGWNRDGLSTTSVDIDDISFFNIRAPSGKPSLLIYMPLFWVWIFFSLLYYRPKIVHACDLDTIFPCYLYKILFKKKLVFEVIDRYAPSKIPPSHRVLYRLVTFMEQQFSEKSDLLITVTQKVLDTFSKREKRYAIIMNCSEENSDISPKLEQKYNPLFTLVYTGAIIKGRGLERITTAMQHVDDVQLLIAGKVIDKELLSEILKSPLTEYKGVLHPSDALSLEAHSDAIVILYDLRKPNNNFASPTKVFEAMRFGIPVITNVAGDLISELECGVLVDYNNIGEIREALIALKSDKHLCEQLGKNGHRGYIAKYNWKLMEQKLHEGYNGLETEKRTSGV